MALLEVKGITKRFGGLVAVDKLSFEVNENEIISIIGPNGAGKTTVFNMITGIYEIDEGEIVFNNEEITNKKSAYIVECGISRTFQNIRLFKQMRVIENVLIGTHIKTNYGFFDALFHTKRFRNEERNATQKAIDILESIGLGDYIDDYANNLPYGLQRRVEIARAIATGAKLIILDEPAAGMNPQESENLLNFIRGLRDKGYTILIIEHDMNVVMNISDRIYVMDYGKRIADGTPQEITSNPVVIKAYLGDASEILEEGEVV
jgi:branched-chain amino acid transport system ATP-binding protein